MPFIRKYMKEKNFVLTLVRDKVDNRMLYEHVHALTNETRDMHPFAELADCSEVHDITGFTESGVMYAASLEHDRIPIKRDRLALLVPNPDYHELANRYKLISEYYRDDVKIFDEFQPAIDWLGLADLEGDINALRQQALQDA